MKRAKDFSPIVEDRRMIEHDRQQDLLVALPQPVETGPPSALGSGRQRRRTGGDATAGPPRARAPGAMTVPQIFIGGAAIGGSDDLAALERQGKLDGLLGL